MPHDNDTSEIVQQFSEFTVSRFTELFMRSGKTIAGFRVRNEVKLNFFIPALALRTFLSPFYFFPLLLPPRNVSLSFIFSSFHLSFRIPRLNLLFLSQKDVLITGKLLLHAPRSML